jgi:2'-5' RNA ligase
LKRAQVSQVERYVDALGSIESPPIPVEAFVLYSSVLESKGARYSIERRFPLRS